MTATHAHFAPSVLHDPDAAAPLPAISDHFIEVHDLSPLRGMSPDKLFADDRKHLHRSERILREVIDLDRSMMQEMNEAASALPVDSVEYLFDIVTRPNSRVGVLHCVGREAAPRVAGFWLTISSPADIPDFHEIPRRLTSHGPIVRAIRWFIEPRCREILRGRFDSKEFLEPMFKLAGTCTIVGKVLVGPTSLPERWLYAQKALRKAGFVSSGLRADEVVRSSDGPAQVLHFEWWTRSPVDLEAAYSAEAVPSRSPKYTCNLCRM